MVTYFGAKMGHDGAKMGHDSAKMGHDSANMGILGLTWKLLGAFWGHLLRISAPGLESEKPSKTKCFYLFFRLGGGSEGVSEASSGLSLALLARRWCFRKQFRTCWRQDGEQEEQDSDLERQDEPT